VHTATTEADNTAAVEQWQKVVDADSPYLPLAQNSGTLVSTPVVTSADYTAAGWQVDLAAIKAK